MTRKILSKTPSGTVDFFGGEDLDYVNQLLTGTDQTTLDPVVINTLWKYRSGILKLANSANTANYSVVGSAIANDRIVTIPGITGDRTFMLAGAPQTIIAKTIAAYNASNTFPNVWTLPITKKHVTMYQGGTLSSNWGFGAGVISTVGTINDHFNSGTDGRYAQFQSGAVSGNQAGQRGNSANIAVCRALQPRFLCKFRIPVLTAMRLFIGFHSSLSAFLTGTDPINAAEGIFLCYRSDVDTNFQIAHNDSSGATVFADTTIPPNTSTINTLEIKAPSGDTKFQWSLNGSALADITTDIPASTTPLYPQVVIETIAAVLKRNDVWYWILEATDP